MINFNSESHLSEVLLGPYSDLNCGGLHFTVQGECFSISTYSDQSATLTWDPRSDDCRQNDASFLTISLKQHPKVRLDLDVWALLFNVPGQSSVFSPFKTKRREESAKTSAEPRSLNHVGDNCATTWGLATHNYPDPAFYYEDCSGPFTFTPSLIVTPAGCVPKITYVDWDLTNGPCPSSAYDTNVSTGANG